MENYKVCTDIKHEEIKSDNYDDFKIQIEKVLEENKDYPKLSFLGFLMFSKTYDIWENKIKNLDFKDRKIIDAYLNNEINNAGIEHIFFKYQKMYNTLTEVINNLDNKEQTSVLDDILNFMKKIIIKLEKYKNEIESK